MIVRLAERRQKLPNDAASWRIFRGLGMQTFAGPRVNESTALNHTIVYACVRFLSRNVAQLPLFVLRRDGDRREKARQHPLFERLHVLANPRHTAAQAIQFLMQSVLLRGNAIFFIERDQSGAIRGLYPLRWDFIRVDIVNGEPVYVWQPADGQAVRPFRRDEIWHVTDLSIDGIVGLSPVATQRETIGHGLAMQEYGARLFANGASPGGVLEHPARLGGNEEEAQAAIDRLRTQWDQLHGGSENAGKVAVLEEGMKWHQIALSQEDAQYLESRKFNAGEIAALFGVPPHLVGQLEKASFASLEEQSLEFVLYHLMPTLVSIEQTISRDLLTEADRRSGLYPKFNVDSLLRGNALARAQAHAVAVQNGWISRNEVRELEDRNPVDGLNTYGLPLNMAHLAEGGEPVILSAPAGAIPGAPTDLRRSEPALPETRQRRDPDRRARLAASFVPLFEELAGRLVRAEIREVGKLLEAHLGPARSRRRRVAAAEKRDPASFANAIDLLYAKEGELHGLFERQGRPAVELLGRSIFDVAADEMGREPDREGLGSFFEAILGAFVARWSISSLRALQAAAEKDPLEARENVSALFEEWKEARPGRVARKETVSQSRAATKEAYRRTGVTTIRWRARGDSCPFCTRLDGAVISVEGVFVAPGETFTDPSDTRKPITTRTSIGHPPLHRGCDCEIEAAS